MQEETDYPRRLGSLSSWKKSSYSSQSGCCVEVAVGAGEIRVRDSKFRRNPANDSASEPMLSFTREEWNAFLAGVKDGEFDDGILIADSTEYLS